MIDIKDKNIDKQITIGSYPIDYKKIGDGDDKFKIFINENALEDIKSYLSSDKTKELGGVLIGNVYFDDAGCKFIIINDLIIARFTDSNITRLTFTHKSWEYINDKIDKEYSDKRVVGWFHSHPGHTVFLSTYDKFIHENFFNRDFMVAYVFDPINGEQDFYFWKNDSIEKSNCFYVYLDYHIDKNKTNITNHDKEEEKKTKNKFNYFIFLISLLALVISFILLFRFSEINNKVSEMKEYDSRLKELNNENLKTNEKIEKLIKNLETNIDSNINNYYSNIIKYQIKPGDTLRKLAILYYNDEGKYNLLIRHNNLKDENDISIGQIIEIPLENK